MCVVWRAGRGETAARALSPRTCCVAWRLEEGLSGQGQRDGEPECFELADVVACFTGVVDAVGVVVWAEFVEPGGGVVEQVPDDDEDGAGHGDERFELSSAFDDASVAFAEEGVGLGCRGGGLTKGTFEVGVAFSGLAGSVG